MIYGGIHGNNLGIHQGDSVLTAYSDCLNAPNANDATCSSEFDADYPIAIAGHGELAACWAFLPPVLVFCFLWIFRRIGRWVWHGFNPTKSTIPRVDR
jgi:hypothetical protein